MVRVFPVYSASTVGGRLGAASDGEVVGGRTSARVSWRALRDRAVLSTAPASSPFPAITAIGVLTATCSVPSGITILASTPSSTASNSIVALSVSISASTSPALTGSPSLFSQRAILPSVIVGDRAGIKTSVVMALSLKSGFGQHVCEQLRRVRLGAVLGELRRLGNQIPDLVLDLLELRLVCAALKQTVPNLFDGIMLGSHFVDFVPGAVFRRVGHGMPAISVGHHLQDDRALA